MVALARRRTFLVVLAGACAAGIGGAVLVSAQGPGTVTGCVNNFGSLRVTSDPSGFRGSACQAPPFEHPVTLDQVGPQGPPGPPGPPGKNGSPGANGTATGTTGSPGTTSSAPSNVIASAAFTMNSQSFVRAEVDCPKGDLATGGSAAVVSPLGESPAFDGPSAGVGVLSATGHPAVGWVAEARNTTRVAASLRITLVCGGPVTDAQAVVRHLILSRRLLPGRKR